MNYSTHGLDCHLRFVQVRKLEALQLRLAGATALPFWLHGRERLDHPRIEQAPRVGPKQGQPLLRRHRIAVRSLARHGVIHIRYGGDACHYRDQIVTQAVRIATAVQAFVMALDELHYLLREIHRVKDRQADPGMLFDDAAFLRGELARLQQDCVTYADLPDEAFAALSTERKAAYESGIIELADKARQKLFNALDAMSPQQVPIPAGIAMDKGLRLLERKSGSGNQVNVQFNLVTK